MKLTYISSACVVVEHEGVRVLCDPWLTDGAYYGSWHHYPPLKHTPEDFSDVDYIYISHVHPDHMDLETLRRLPRDIPVLVHAFAENFLTRILQGAGFVVTALPHGQRWELAPGFTMETLAADNCDPVVCSTMFGCLPPASGNRSAQIDSLAVFSGGGKVLVNNNDCPYPLAHDACELILARYGHVDMLLTGYSGASSYPQCYDNYDPAEMVLRADAKREKCLRMAGGYIRQLAPDHFMPFAGQYVLGGRLGALNGMRGMPEMEDLTDIFARLLRRGSNARMVLLNDGESFDLDAREPSAPFVPPDPVVRARYVRENLAAATYAYDVPHGIGDLSDELVAAHERMRRHQDAWGYRSDWTLYFTTDIPDAMYRVPFDGTEARYVGGGSSLLDEPYLRVSLPAELLRRILTREAHFNNAEVGSHMRFLRVPDVYAHVQPMLLRLACYLHA